MKKLPWGREYLRAYIDNLAPSKAYYRLLQKQSKKTNSNLSPRQYDSTNSKVYDGSNKKMWLICQVHHHHHH